MSSLPFIPDTGEMIVVEMNPRVSRSSALASKATGFPIAKIAAKLAVGYTLDEIPNDITGETMASFEPTIDYCVVKIPRWTFEKFPETQDYLTTSMKSVGETMSIGRTFKEALQKGIRSLEIGRLWPGRGWKGPVEAADPGRDRTEPGNPQFQADILHCAMPCKAAWISRSIYELTRIDPWFLHQIRQIVEMEPVIAAAGNRHFSIDCSDRPRQRAFRTSRLPCLTGCNEDDVRTRRSKNGDPSGV